MNNETTAEQAALVLMLAGLVAAIVWILAGGGL